MFWQPLGRRLIHVKRRHAADGTLGEAVTKTKALAKDGGSRGPDYLSADERRARGKALRDKVSRGSQAGWKAGNGRRDPVDLGILLRRALADAEAKL